MILPQIPPTLRENDAFTYRATTVEVEEIVETDVGLTVYMKRRRDEEDDVRVCYTCDCDLDNDPLTAGCQRCTRELQDALLEVHVDVTDAAAQDFTQAQVEAAHDWALQFYRKAREIPTIGLPLMPEFLEPFRMGHDR